MSTRSRIAIKQKDNTYKSVYCHSDGYPSYNGVILQNCYNDPVKLNMLINLGDLSSLGERVIPEINEVHTFGNSQRHTTVAYHRDRNEDIHFRTDKTLDDLVKFTCESDQEYLYVYDNKKWIFAKVDFKQHDLVEFEDLEQHIKSNNLQEVESVSIEDEIASNVVCYAKDFDQYDFNDQYRNEEEAIIQTKKDLANRHSINEMIKWLGNDIIYLATEKGLDSDETSSLSSNAFKLINDLSVYSQTCEKVKEDNELTL